MKKNHLLAGCSVLALAVLAASPASAQFVVKLGGNYDFFAGYIGQSNDKGKRTTEFNNRFRLTVDASNKADNGLEYGVHLRLRTVSNSSGGSVVDYDRAYSFAQGAFGLVQLGDLTGPGDTQRTGVLDWGTGAATDGWVDNWIPSSTFLDVRTPMSGDTSSRINYYTPRIAGVQVGLSYMPKGHGGEDFAHVAGSGGSNGTDLNLSKRNSTASNVQDIYEIGFGYVGAAGPVTINLNGEYEGGNIYGTGVGGVPTGSSLRPLSAYQAGGKISYAGLDLGGDFVYAGKSGYARNPGATNSGLDSQLTYDVGLQYTTGPILVGINYAYGQGGGAVEQGGSYSVGGHRNTKLYSAGATYTIAPGFTAGIEYDYFKIHYTDAAQVATATDSPNDRGSVVILTTGVSF
ncbi:MAG: porin [Azospirillaceae bacterium]|nr:porin [Azospirillaceae bacterium]